jgi:hypothetical protein
LESDIAKRAALELQEEAHAASSSLVAGAKGPEASQDFPDTERNVASSSVAEPDTAAVPDSSGLKEDDENDGDDEGGAEEEEDEGEILEGAEGQGKRSLEGDNGSPRSKRRKL